MEAFINQKYLVFDSEQEAIERENKLTIDANFNDGVTVKYADVKKLYNQEKWCIPILKDFQFLFTQEEHVNAIELSEYDIAGYPDNESNFDAIIY